MSDRQIYRAAWHDYRERCIYMVTLSKNGPTPDFGTIAGDCRIKPGLPGCAHIELSSVGKTIRNAIHAIPEIEPAARVLQYSVMPDHVHILLFVQSTMADPLGNLIARLKQTVNKAYGAIGVFDKGFHDRILTRPGQLDTLYRYIRENPHRLAARRQFPEYFSRVNSLTVAGRRCQAYGNLMLLRDPLKEQVVIHRADTPETRRRHSALWLYTAANRGVLVSPFISPDEKAVRIEAEALGGKTILITNSRMGERYKPAARDFAICEAGRLLIIAPDDLDQDLTRRTCMAMNNLAKDIC